MHHFGQVSITQPIQFEFVTIAKKEYASLASSICNKHTRSLNVDSEEEKGLILASVGNCDPSAAFLNKTMLKIQNRSLHICDHSDNQ